MTTMIARTENQKSDVWGEIAAPLPPGVIQWRQQGKPTSRDGKHFARFVAYIDAQFVRERLDTAIKGEWDLTLELLPPAVTGEGEEVEPFSFKARLQILGVSRESVGSGKDYKTAETDAFKRAAVRFGVGSELYAMEQVWVQMDGDGKYAKALEDPSTAYTRRHGRSAPAPALTRPQVETALDMAPAAVSVPAPSGEANGDPVCPKCDGPLWDNRVGKRNPRAPDWKCKDRTCDGVIWPPKEPARRTEPELEEIPF